MPEPDPIAELSPTATSENNETAALTYRLHNALDWLGPDANQAVTAVLKELENT